MRRKPKPWGKIERLLLFLALSLPSIWSGLYRFSWGPGGGGGDQWPGGRGRPPFGTDRACRAEGVGGAGETDRSGVVANRTAKCPALSQGGPQEQTEMPKTSHAARPSSGTRRQFSVCLACPLGTRLMLPEFLECLFFTPTPYTGMGQRGQCCCSSFSSSFFLSRPKTSTSV